MTEFAAGLGAAFLFVALFLPFIPTAKRRTRK